MSAADETPRPLTARQAERRERVLAAAVELAASGGYDAVHMRGVAAAADVAIGTVYRYFESKDHLLAAALVEQVRGIEALLSAHPPRRGEPVERLVRFLRRAGDAVDAQPQLYAAFIAAITASGPVVSACQQEVIDVLSEALRSAMDGIDAMTQDTAVRVLMHVWFSSLVGSVNGWTNVTTVADELEVAARKMLA